MQPFYAPSVFGFFLPTYKPAGIVADSGLVSPQAELTTAPNLVGYLNGMRSLVDFGNE